MTPPPTNANPPPPGESLWARARQRVIVFYYSYEDLFPRFARRVALAWLQLLRLPNLLTLPGDVLAGFLLSSAAGPQAWLRLLLALPASLLFYAAGLILNDLFDYAEDLRERPTRPLPARLISREAATACALIFLWVAVFFAAFFNALRIAVPLVLAIVLYNIGLKRHRYAGPLLMGACRAGNLLLGAAAATNGASPTWAPVTGALLLGSYIALVTWFAREEMEPNALLRPHQIGHLLGLLMPIQATLCAVAIHRFPANFLGFALLALLPLHHRLSLRFPPS